MVTAALLGAMNYRVGREARAVEFWEQARRDNPDMIIPRVGLAAHYESVGRHDEAATLVKEILRVNPNLRAEFWSSTISSDDVELLRRAGLP